MVDWKKSKWRLRNMVSEEMDRGEVCREPLPREILFPSLQNFPELVELCQTLRGRLVDVADEEVQRRLLKIYRRQIRDISGVYGTCNFNAI